MNNKSLLLLIFFAQALMGCGTLYTLARKDSTTQRELKQANTYCESITRIYSGVAYDFCLLNSPPDNMQRTTLPGFVPLIFFDFFASGLLDTIVLPYTIYRQGDEGSLQIK